MGMIRFSHPSMLSRLLTPAQALSAWFVPAQRSSGKPSRPQAPEQASKQLPLPFSADIEIAPGKPVATPCTTDPSDKASMKATTCHRLKVVREFDAGVAPACAGRMVISGRMSDVCAELERMSLREATVRSC
ncbi:hypothetical protein SAMN05216344_12251 [Polaromonas sp. OV174]|uniref:hypothetical protein n=1 Tax=Polaromonas sp. OV174 TaxID=1855300 RepID=UPI0008E4343E|nr:hypothetical protein [Polaromonas sp. OV174]SFC56612.1 hypothetical protein SAMN05216344_12251 [Polaromonas sp. OV174]